MAQWLASKGRRDEALEAAREAVRRNPADTRSREVLQRLEGGR
jgi:hypothetical protein